MSDEIKICCQHCDGHISFPMEMAGQTIACPHCAKQIVLTDRPTTHDETKLTSLKSRSFKPIHVRLLLGVCAAIFTLGIAGWYWEVHVPQIKKTEQDELAVKAAQDQVKARVERENQMQIESAQKVETERMATKKQEDETAAEQANARIRSEQERRKRLTAIQDASKKSLDNLLFNPGYQNLNSVGLVVDSAFKNRKLPEPSFINGQPGDPNNETTQKYAAMIILVNSQLNRLTPWAQMVFAYDPKSHLWAYKFSNAVGGQVGSVFSFTDLDPASGVRYYKNHIWCIEFTAKNDLERVVTFSTINMSVSHDKSLVIYCSSDSLIDRATPKGLDTIMVEIAEIIKAYGSDGSQDSTPSASEASTDNLILNPNTTLGALNLFYNNDAIVKDNPVATVKNYRSAAEQGDAMAQFFLGFAYYKGFGVPQDYVESARWYRKAAQQGSAAAQVNLGTSYNLGLGVEKDLVEAAKLFRKAADQRDPMAQCLLGEAYYKGNGVPQDKAEAVKWYQKAIDQGMSGAKQTLENLQRNDRSR